MIAQATQEALREEAEKANAPNDMKTKAIGQASGPTVAPQDTGDSKMRGSSEGSSDGEDEDLYSSRRGRFPSRRRASPSTTSPPPGDFQRSYKPKRRRAPRSASQVSERSEGNLYKVKFAQVVDDIGFDVADLLHGVPKSALTSPAILSFKTRAPEAKVVSKLDEIIPTDFRVYYKDDVFHIRAPRQPARKPQRRSKRSEQKAQTPRGPPPCRRRPGQLPEPPRVQLRPRQQRSPLVFRSGVLERTCAQDEQATPFTLWPKRCLATLAAPGQHPTQSSSPVVCEPRPKKQARQAAAPRSSCAPHPEHVADLLRSIADVVAPRPTSEASHLLQLRTQNDMRAFADHAQSGFDLAPIPVGGLDSFCIDFGGNGRRLPGRTRIYSRVEGGASYFATSLEGACALRRKGGARRQKCVCAWVGADSGHIGW